MDRAEIESGRNKVRNEGERKEKRERESERERNGWEREGKGDTLDKEKVKDRKWN